MNEQVTITINPDASVKIAVNGMAGGGCKALTAGLEKALGTVTSDKPTIEMYQTATQSAKAGR